MLYNTGLPIVMAGVAMVLDLRTARVDNGWIVFCLGIGLAARLLEKGPGGLWDGFMGILLPAAVLGWLFLLRMLGAGDIKLLCALGSILGAAKILECIFFSMLIGAGISAAILISTGGISQRFLYFILYVRELISTGKITPYYRGGMSSPENFHFTVPVFLSVVLYAGGAY
ncbi:prepilin peptidase [Ruminococcus sp. 5_1_39BFAA]|uniref:prepilin peptidase n=1 Tax=Ruminococcus sp. 5_1_39BFAA TaxID=457412 RepID=UPI0035640AEB